MIKRTLIKATSIQSYKTTSNTITLNTFKKRAITTCAVDNKPKTNKFLHNNYTHPQWMSKRLCASVPESVTIKVASAENGINITDRAVKQLKTIQQRDNDTEQMLRILVDSGGCHGYQNKMELTNTIDEDDTIFEKDGVRVVVDSISLQFLRGSVVDYVQELIGSTFQVIDNPNAKHSCGCNISYDIDLDKIH
ncbi:MAG: hypothetical protein EXX96DRAFT_546451 [Benjaminiella poitrasii]|nr:MAG: hypothetical protein EXX96DRAFT_546451 [Benjaminiella poitrasii]